MSSSYKNPYDMTPAEITAYLNSGSYISASIRKTLEDKLNYAKNSNRYNVFNNFFDNMPTEKNEIIIDNNVENYPSLGNNDTVDNSTDNKQNYASLFNIGNNENEVDQKSDSLFVNGKMILYFNDIQRTYDAFGIYRIRMQYLIFNRNIHLLNTLAILNREKACYFKKKLDYDSWIIQEEQLRDCIHQYIELKKIIQCFDIINKILSEYKMSLTIGSLPINSKISQLFETLLANYKNILCMIRLSEELAYFFNIDIKKIIIFIENILNKTGNNTSQDIDLRISESSEFLSNLNSAINKLVKENDPHIECEYLISLSKDNPIKLLSVCSVFYIQCDEQITLSTRNINIPDKLLANIDYDEFINKISKTQKQKSPFFFKIFINDQQKHFHFFYTFEEKIPIYCTTLNILNLPKNSFIFSTMMVNQDLNPKIIPKYTKIGSPPRHWLNKHCNIQHHNILQDDYNCLNNVIKYKYPYEDTSKYLFTVDYLFNKLLSTTEGTTVIHPGMINSFRRLAENTSIYPYLG